MFRLLETVLFKTDSVFDALFACFDETIDFYQWIKPWKSYITVAKVQKQNMNEFATVPKGSDLLYYTNGSHKVFVKFFVKEVFEERGVTDVRRINRGKSSSLGMTKAPQVNIPRILKHLSLGMPRLASHLSSSTIIGIPRFLFRSCIMCKSWSIFCNLVFTFILCTMLV